MDKIKTILVTGGAGFIGSNFVRLMINKYPKYRIINFDKLTYAGNPDNIKDIEDIKNIEGRKNYEFVCGDICDKNAVAKIMKEKNVDAVIHFAAESHVDNSIDGPHVFTATNVLGTHVLLEEARKNNVKRFLHVSTDEVYGSILDGSFTEESILAPNSPYSASKAASDLLAKAYFKTYGFPVIITRSSNNFGPYQYPEKVMPLFITNLIEGKKVPLYGDGMNVRDWIYVTDNCEAIDFVFHNGKIGEIYNIGGGNEKPNIFITKKLLSILGKDESFIQYVKDRPGHDRRYSLNTGKIRALGWKPRFNFENALKETAEWYKNNEKWWKKLKIAKEMNEAKAAKRAKGGSGK